MLKRKIPSSGEMLPVVGLGTYKCFDTELVHSDNKNALLEVLHMLSNTPGSVIDSSPMYGRSEQVVGMLTQETEKSDSFFYATKVWTTGRQEGIQQMQQSMQKMQRGVMDLIQVHNLVDYKTHLKTLQQWKEEGKVRYIGITHYQSAAHESLSKIIETENIDFVQFNYSIQRRDAENKLLSLARDKGVAVIINEPLEKGMLLQKVRGKSLPSWCTEFDIDDWPAFFLKYILSHDAVTCIIPATSNPRHMLSNLGSGVGKLPDEKGRVRMVEFFENI